MILRLSTLFLRTLREDPADAEVASHRLLVRAGYIRRVAPGIFSMLPLGLKVQRNIERVVREEMETAGGQELLFPALLPREPYELTGRWTEYGDTLFRLKDRRDNDFLLGPTHEELFTLTVKDLCSSYKDLPLTLFQIQAKFRDEARPRAGILRGREFVMKDSYSFDLDEAGLQEAYDRHRDAYIKIFDRLGIEYVICSAMAGAMGGSKSEEFLAISPIGEDTLVRCQHGDYAANVEAVTTVPPAVQPIDGQPAAEVVDTPDAGSIDALVVALNGIDGLRSDGAAWTAADTLKVVLVMLKHPDGTRSPLAIGVPGNRDIDMRRLEANVSPAEVLPLTGEDLAQHPTVVAGYMGPGALGEESASGIRFLLDPRIVEGTRWVTGADEAGRHRINMVAGRDFSGDGTIESVEVLDGDRCPVDGGELEILRGIEIGHIFQLGQKYAQALGLSVLDENGKPVVVTMGSYGIGITRAIGVIAEQNADDRGLCWPREIAPADVHLVAAGKADDIVAAADQLAADLEAAGLRVLYDDRRQTSPGVKFKDAELIGIPTTVVIGKRLADGIIELKDRRADTSQDIPAAHPTEAILQAVRQT